MLDKICDAISSDEAVTNATGVLDIADGVLDKTCVVSDDTGVLDKTCDAINSDEAIGVSTNATGVLDIATDDTTDAIGAA